MSVPIATVCRNYLKQGSEDDGGGVVLVAIADELDKGFVEAAAETMVQDVFQPLLVKFGWDILSLFTPHLHPSHPNTLELIQKITKLCSAKEMCLALLEQMETVTSERVFTFFLLLQPLQSVLQLKRTIDSSLNSVRILLHQHYPKVPSENQKDKEKQKDKDNESEEDVEKGGGVTSDHEREEEGKGRQGTTSPSSSVAMTVHQAASHTLDFLQPFVEQLHAQQVSTMEKAIFSQPGWSYRQRQCISMLLCLLDYPLISHNLNKTNSSKCTHRQSRELAERIMASIVTCHCGAVGVLSWRERVELSVTPTDLDDDDLSPASLSALGLGCFAYLLLVEAIQTSYLPAILNPSYLLHVNIPHVEALIKRPEKRTINKGLALLEVVLGRIAPHSLSPHTLDDSRYLDMAKLLTNLMVSCEHKKVRQRSVPLLQRLITSFSRAGRHRVYRNLLRSVSHAGVKGLLVHDIKNEVAQALKSEVPAADQPFLGSRLISLLGTVATVSAEEELLQEMDRIMPVLNFLRYLLIRDKQETNITGIWDESVISDVRDKFVVPLRELLVVARAHSKQQLEIKVEEGKRGRKREGANREEPELNVQVMGTTLPKISLQEELEMLNLAGHQFDMLDSVLVRVEELIDNRTSN